MSVLGRRISLPVVAALVGAMVVVALLPVLTSAPAREVTLVVRDMTFFLESDPLHPNPTIDVKAGERVRVIVKNQDRGMTHDFAVPAINAAMSAINWNQENGITFAVPSTPGTYEYVCRPHQLMMRGILRVTAD